MQWIIFIKEGPCASVITTTEILLLISYLFIGAYTFNCALWDLLLDLSDIICFILVLNFPLYLEFFLLYFCSLIQLLSARDMAQRTVIGQDRIVYSTDRDIIEQDYEAKEWDMRIREIEKSD